jgi:hypothetical protein
LDAKGLVEPSTALFSRRASLLRGTACLAGMVALVGCAGVAGGRAAGACAAGGRGAGAGAGWLAGGGADWIGRGGGRLPGGTGGGSDWDDCDSAGPAPTARISKATPADRRAAWGKGMHDPWDIPPWPVKRALTG